MEIKETREEILKRAKEYRIRQQKRILGLLEAAGVLVAALILGVVKYLPGSHLYDTEGNNYGTLAFGAELGGYILIGILCFLMGMILTLIIVRRRSMEQEENKEKKD